jgi:hypothetical protein
MLWTYADHTVKETHMGEIAGRESSGSPEVLDRDAEGIPRLLTHNLHPRLNIVGF